VWTDRQLLQHAAADQRRAAVVAVGDLGERLDMQVVRLKDPSGEREIIFEPQYEFYMLGLGYGHPKWGHGANHGQLAVEREDLKLSEIDPHLPQHLHVQALCKVTYKGGNAFHQEGRGVLEQLAIGPHAPSGFKQMLDFAP
jgi:hypothetical protein